jgi:hypothetical protein
MADNIQVVNTIWKNASTTYQDRIPQATRDNITAIGNMILSADYVAQKNEFLNALVNRISMTIVSSKLAKNRLAAFKKGMVQYGSDIEEVFVSIASAQTFDQTKAEAEIFKRKFPDVQAAFHRLNRADLYKVTITDFQLRHAFLSSDGMGKLVSAIVNSLYSGDNYDEYTLMKNVVADYFTNQLHAKTVTVTDVTDQTTAQDFMRTIKQTSTDFEFVSSEFNPSGVLTFTEKSDQVLLIHKNIDTNISTDLLAWAFNNNQFDVNVQKVVVDNFGSMPNTAAVLMDRSFFMVFDKLFETRNQYNGEGLYTNYWLHHHQTLSASPFANAVAFQVAP